MSGKGKVDRDDGKEDLPHLYLCFLGRDGLCPFNDR